MVIRFSELTLHKSTRLWRHAGRLFKCGNEVGAGVSIIEASTKGMRLLMHLLSFVWCETWPLRVFGNRVLSRIF